MAYDPTLPTTLDRIRMIVGDTSNDPDTEWLSDATYTAVIAEHTNWKRAAAVIAESIAVAIEQDPTSFTATGDMSVGWGDRTRSLRAIAARLRGEAGDEDVSVSNRIVAVPLEREGTLGRGEYRDTRYSRLKR